MSFVNTFKSKFYLKKYDLLKTGSSKTWAELLMNEKRSSDELLDISFASFNCLVSKAYQESNFYRNFYSKAGFAPGDLKSWDDVEKLPTLGKCHLNENASDIMVRGTSPKQHNKISTGGSTGNPVSIYHPKSVNRAAALWRMKRWWGLEPASNFGTIYRDSSEGLGKWKNRIVNWPLNIVRLDASNISEDGIKSFIATWNELKPQLLHGYVGGLMALADYLDDHPTFFYSPKAIWSTSAPISKIQKVFLEKIFDTKVYDQYGCCEVFYLAAEGPEKNGLRIFNDLRHIEVVDDQNKVLPYNKEGRILITDYENSTFPLIRYENGDLGSKMMRSSDCDHPYQLLHPVKGRQSETLLTCKGGKITGEYLTTIFDDYADQVRQFKVHQNQDLSIVIYVVPRGDQDLRVVTEKVRNNILLKTDTELNISIKLVTEITHDRGKLRFITTDVKS